MSATLKAAQARAAHYAARNSAFTKPTSKHLEKIKSLLEAPCPRSGRKGTVQLDQDAIAPHNVDWTNHVAGSCPALLLPTCTEHVASVLRYCNEEKLAVVPQGGNTGLVYGGQPLFDELVLSLQNMNAAPRVDEDTLSVEAESGVILQKCQEACEASGLLFPLSMGSKGSAMMGGCVSTNAGGIYYARYGSMHANVLGLEVVTAEGKVLDLMSTLRKDNAGYDMKHLFIGSEGTLGVVTRSAVKLFPQPASQQLVLLRVPDFECVLTLYKLAQKHLGECLAAVEVVDAESFRPFAAEELPMPHGHDDDRTEAFQTGASYASCYFTVLIETHGSNGDHEIEKLGSMMEAAQEALQGKLDGDGRYEPVLSQSAAQSAKLWALREDVPVRLASSGDIYKFDVSFPLDRFYSIVEHTREMVYKKAKLPPQEVWVVGYGHFGDGNVHLNVIDVSRTHEEQLLPVLYPGVYEFCAQHGGSISAEHGVGLQKRDYLPLSRSDACIEQMRAFKRVMDPNGILNPYKVLPML
eukprot:gene9839-6912_t